MEKKKLFLIAGFIVGILSFIFLLTDTALSYSDNARFCLNCHSMDEAYEALQNSNHKQLKCTDCHAPHSYVPKVVFKTKSGMRDLYATVTNQIPQVIEATHETKEIIAANCLRCHSSTVEQVDMGNGKLCTDCHRNSVHVRK